MADKNYISINGDGTGRVWCDGLFDWQPDLPDALRVVPFNVIQPEDMSYADALKISNAQNVQVEAYAIHGGAEDCVDINNRCRGIKVFVGEFHPRGKYAITIKGESDDIEISGMLVGHGSEMDVDLGNHSDQAKGRTRRVRLNLTTKDNSKIHVRVLHAWRPELLNGADKYEIHEEAKGFFNWLFSILKALKLA